MRKRKDSGSSTSKADMLRELTDELSAESTNEAVKRANRTLPIMYDVIWELNFELGKKNAKAIRQLHMAVAVIFSVLISAVALNVGGVVFIKRQFDRIRHVDSASTTVTEAYQQNLLSDDLPE